MVRTLRPRFFPAALTLLWLALPTIAYADSFAGSVVNVRAIGPDGAVQLGSGVKIGAERVATACHVTRHARRIEIAHGTRRWLAETQVGSLSHDLCVLKVRADDIPIARMRPSAELKPGEQVIAAGFEGGRPEIVLGRGFVAALYSYDEGRVIRTSAPFDFGSSGGGLFDEEGNLVGLLAFKARSGENLRFALPSEWTSPRSAVAQLFAPIEPTASRAAFWERPQGDRPSFLGVALREAAQR